MNVDPREVPTYTVTDAARYLGMSVDTLRRWSKGYDFKTRSGKSHSRPLIKIAGSDPSMLSFYNLIETHILSVMRKQHGLKMHRVRTAIEYLKKNLPSPHPLIDYKFKTDGVHIFLEQAVELEIISQEGQLAMGTLLEKYLDRIEWDDRNLAARLFPFTNSLELGDIRVVVIDPRISFGRPAIYGTGIPTAIIAERFEAGESLKDLMKDYGRAEKEIEEAIRCELYWRKAA